MATEELKRALGEYCREYRAYIVRTTLVGMSEQTGIKSRTLSNFENGRSANIGFIAAYMSVSKSADMKADFIVGLFEILDKYGEKLGGVMNGREMEQQA